LVRGSVQIDGERNEQQEILAPGEQVELVGNDLVKTKVDTELFTSWKDGKMVLRRESFPNLMKRLERWFNVKIDYSPDDFEGLWYSGTIEMETLTEVMDMVSTAAPIQFTFNNKTRVIKIVPQKR
jgi:ferric-dicitrate binding protein FerR (iron transport regulator)